MPLERQNLPFEFVPQVFITSLGDLATSRCALQKANLYQIRLIYVLYSFDLFARSSGECR
jgi:hypothetical protein